MDAGPPHRRTHTGAQRRSRGRAIAWGLGAALVSSAGACNGSVGADTLAETIAKELKAQGLPVSVVCPAAATARVGDVVACTAIAVDDPGRTALVVRARIVDGSRVALEPQAALAVARATPAIRHALAGRGIEAQRIDCGGVLARAGDPLRCDIEASDGRRFRWTAVVGADGHARGELVAR